MSVDRAIGGDEGDIVQTALRPDIVIWYEQAKKVILVELTIPLGGEV